MMRRIYFDNDKDAKRYKSMFTLLYKLIKYPIWNHVSWAQMSKSHIDVYYDKSETKIR